MKSLFAFFINIALVKSQYLTCEYDLDSYVLNPTDLLYINKNELAMPNYDREKFLSLKS